MAKIRAFDGTRKTIPSVAFVGGVCIGRDDVIKSLAVMTTRLIGHHITGLPMR